MIARIVALGALAGALTFPCLAGCGKGANALKTYPVSGKVVYKGGAPMAGGAINFISTSDPNVRAVGDIGQDGSFTLHTLVGNDKLPGAVEGTHDIEVLPLQDEKQHMPVVRVLQKQVKVEPGGSNNPTIEVEKLK